MRSPALALFPIWASLVPLATPQPQEQPAHSRPYSTWLADSIISANLVPQTRWYSEATFYRGLEAVHNHTSDPKYLDFLTAQIDAVLTPIGDGGVAPLKGWDYTDHQLDNIRVGSTILYLHTLSPGKESEAAKKYKAAAGFLHGQLTTQYKRTASGAFWHKERYPNQLWLDGLFMAGPFSAAYAALFDPRNKTLWDDVALQFELAEKHCRNKTSGMLKHGYDESGKAVWADKVTGASPLVWIRAQGWYFMALLDVLGWFPRDHEGYAKIKGWFVELAEAVKREQDKSSGGWWLVMDEGYPGREGNYIESSGSSMYTYGLFKGIREGILDRGVYGETAERAYKGLVERFVTVRNGTNGTEINWEGTVRVGSLDGKGDYPYYTGINRVQNSLIGVGPFLLASVEWEKYQSTRS
ncbi:glycosyl hydrolase [Cladorrhinum samala]|uniref:Glycosyl hydrolase n=1 Tax=Cladorrhinum samala TaxID=585594 RepID=A0AAV9HZB4_9PEZI|nr:glycosyl hydrolase [Cladorrhinum samala]